MKKIAYILAATLAAFACSKEMDVEIPSPEEEIANQTGNVDGIRTVHFTANLMDTKAQFGEAQNGYRPTLWTDNDTALKLSMNYGSALTAGVTPSQDKTSAEFSANIDFTGVSGTCNFYAVSPASAASALSPSREAWKVSIPCEQTPTASSVAEGAIIIAAASSAEAGSIGDVSLNFYHLTAYGRMSLKNFTLADGESVQAVDLTFTTPVVGDWFWKCEEEQGEHALIDYGASSTITINTSLTSGIWFGCAPVDVSDEAVHVTVYTTRGKYEQLALFPANRKFTAGQVAVFSVDMDGVDCDEYSSGSGSGTGAFTLVTDESMLQVGDEIIITNTAGAKALGSNAGGYRNAVDITVSNDAISSTGDACILTLAAGSTSGRWALHASDGYLATSSTKNNLTVSQSIGETSSWSISITSGVAAIVAQSGTYNYLQYNSGSPRFSGYAATQQNVKIYRRSAGSGSGGVSADPLLSESEYGCYLGTGYTWTLNAGSDQVTRSYDSNGVQTYTMIDPSDVEELEISGYTKSKVKGDRFEITVRWRKGTSILLSQVYSVTLIKEEGPKVWLSDGNGNGVIIKK